MNDTALHIDLSVHLDYMFDSDYDPFEAQGIVVIGAYHR